MQRKVLLSFAVAAFAAAVSAQTVIIPPAANGADGNTTTTYPFDIATIHVQYIYDSSNFTAQGITSPIVITGIKLRANQTATATTSTSWTGGTSQLQVDLSTAPIDYLTITNTFASNHGADQATVFNGPLTTLPGSTTVGVPGPFHVDIPFSAPFLYDPNAGDLTIDYLSSGITTAAMPTLDAISTAGVALARRTYNTTSLTTTTGTIWSGEIANPLEISYTPATGLFASFAADVTSGPTPLTVNFTDHTFTSDVGGVLTWAWDFNGDSIVDSNLQNPSFTYTTCGTYNVSLTVTDSSHPSSTLTKTNLISTDDITAGFSMSLLAPPNVFQLTDTSSPPATAWAWDFDGDTIIDSTQQNPVVVLPLCQSANITLTATRNCKSDTVSQTNFVSTNNLAAQLPSTANNGLTNAITFSDYNVTNPIGINICGFEHHLSNTAGTPFTFDVYVTPTTYVGKDNDITQWRLAGSGSGVSAGTGNLALGALNSPLYLPAGSYGIGIFLTGSLRYTGTGTGGTPGVYSNADLTITTGAARSTLFNNGSFFSIRQWNGVVHYDTPQTGGTPGMGFFGPGCAGTMPISQQTVNSGPLVGGTLSVTYNNLPFNFGVNIIGFSNTLFAGSFPLPIDLGIIGAPGCFGRISDDLESFMFGAGNQGTFSGGVPANPALVGVPFFTQAAVADTVNAFGFVFSDAWGGSIGL